MSYKPRIGLTMRLELETRRFYLGRDYSEALAAAGALPVHIPLIPEADMISGILEGLDGLLLPGSDTDVDPAYFGEEPHPSLKRVVPEKDSTEMLVLEHAERRGIPILAICYGMQALNVSRGGSLIQDIGSQLADNLKHEQGLPLERNSHSIDVHGSSLLASIVSGPGVKVNSHHHQAIRSVGTNLRVSATAPDGVIECIEDERDDRFVLGVQWHPELSWRTECTSREIFQRFVDACRTTSAAAAGD